MDKIYFLIVSHIKQLLYNHFIEKERHCEIQVKLQNLKFETIPIVIKLILNKIIESRSLSQF